MTRQLKSFRVRAVDYLKNLMDSGELPTQKAAGEKLGVSQQVIQKFLKTGAMGTPTIERMIELYPGAREYIYNPGHELVEAEPVPDDGFMEVPWITTHAGLPEDWGQETMNKLPKYKTEKRTDGNYVCFSVIGDSMDYPGKLAICEGDIVLGRELQQHHWRNKLHFNRALFIIITRERGAMVKQVVSHDVDRGVITLHSFNEEYPDLVISLDEVVKIFYVKEVKTRRHYL